MITTFSIPVEHLIYSLIHSTFTEYILGTSVIVISNILLALVFVGLGV